MIYYLFLAIVDIGWYLWDNKLNLSITLVASGIGVILGKRLGTRIAINYILRRLGLEKKSTLERQVAWLLEQERVRGNVWSVSMLPSEGNVLVARLKSLHKVGLLARFASVITRQQAIYPYIRRSRNMSRKLIMMMFGAIVMVFSEFGITLDPETIIGMCTLLISAIFGQAAVDSNGVGQYAPLKQKLKSVKLWTALGGSVLLVVSDFYGLNISETVIYLFTGLGATFIISRSAVSVVQASKNAGGNDDKLDIPIEPTI